jgi:hypothetical protein
MLNSLTKLLERSQKAREEIFTSTDLASKSVEVKNSH